MMNLFLLTMMSFLVVACAVPQNKDKAAEKPEQSKYRRDLSSISRNV